MSDRVLVTWRHGPAEIQEASAGAESVAGDGGVADALAADFAELAVEQRVAQGVIARTPDVESGDEELFRRLESGGYRVKWLKDTNLIDVGGYRVDVESTAEADDLPADLRVPPELAATWPHHLVQLAGPPTPEWIARIEREGVDVAEPISRYALFVCASPERVAALQGLRLGTDPAEGSFVTWTGPFQPAYRIAHDLAQGTADASSLLVSVFPDEQASATAAAIAQLGARVVDEWGEEGRYRDRFSFLVVAADAGAVAGIARLPFVRSVEPHATSLTSDSERSAQILAARLDGTPAPKTAPVAGYRTYLSSCGLDGSGVVLGICDSGVDTNDDQTLHPDLRGRLAFFEDVTGGKVLKDQKGHGTHVAGIALGGGTSGTFSPGGWTLGLGVAPAARFGAVNAVNSEGPGTKPVDRYTALMVRNGAHVMNNSWRQGGPAGYSSNAALVDRLARDPTGSGRTDPAGDYLVIVFSAGNAGPAPGSITEPKEAKNPITVGNSRNWNKPGDDIRGVAQTSSRGPARDGRILPTVVAPGTNVVSARTTFQNGVGRPGSDFVDGAGNTHADHTLMSGTSMAAPHVAGACALLIQWWMGHHGGRKPSLAMLKALLVNGAEDLAGGPSGRMSGANEVPLDPIPNNDQGWGRVCVQNIVADHPATQRGPRIMLDQAAPFRAVREQHSINVCAHDPDRPLRVTLAWTDAPGAPNASPALVNDLDLEVVETVDGVKHIYKGNHFENGFSVPDAGEADSLNNLECVYIEKPKGTYEVIVIAQTLTGNALPPFTGPAFQDYALVIDNADEAPGGVAAGAAA